MLCVVITTALFLTYSAQAVANVTKTVSFQGRLLTSSGAVVADGYYNMQFKIYEGGSGNQAGNPDGSLKWTESYVNNGGTSGIRVKNGVFTVNLGSKTTFGTSVNWDHESLWLSMNIAGNSTSCSEFGISPCVADGEMLPMKRMTAVPYAINSGQLNGKTADDFFQKTESVQEGSLEISGSLQSNTSLLAPSLDTSTATELTIGSVNATSIAIGNNESTTIVNGGLVATSIDSLPAPEPAQAESFGIFSEPVWEEKTGSGIRNWRSVTASADGTKLAAAEAGGSIYTSNDSGNTWQQTSSGARDWRSVASSDDGTKLVATVWSGYIYTSEDSGATWQQQTASNIRNWTYTDTSADGSIIIASVLGGYLYRSENSGSTWSQISSAGTDQWESVASSADGLKLAAVSSNGYVHTSSDGGSTWTARASAGSRAWSSVTSSDDGTKLAAAAIGNFIYLSQDSGATWQQATSVGSRNWRSITSSADGTRLAAAALGDYIYNSNNSGLDWTEGTSAGTSSWVSVTSSADGNTMAATASGDYIYMLHSSPTETPPPTQSGSTLSIGSTNASEIIVGNSQSKTQIQGNLEVNGSTLFGGSVNIKTEVDSSQALRVQSANGSQLFNVNSSNNTVSIGQVDNEATLLVLDTKSSIGDPSGTNGAMYYNSSLGKFRCFESGAWKDCVTPLPISKVAETDTTNSTTTPVDVNDLSFTLAPNTKYYYKFVIIHEAANSTTGVGFGVTTPTNPTMNNWCVNTTATIASSTPGHWGSYCGVGDASSTVTTKGQANLGTKFTSTMEGYIQTSGNTGNLRLRMVSESANQTTVRNGSFGILQIVQ